MGGRLRRCVGIVAVLAALFASAGVPTASAEVSSAEIVHLLSAQREANGIPGGLLERSEWSADCAKHNYYEAQTGEFGHSENPSSPYYTAEGDWAARNSVLAYGSSWSNGNPWEEAPIHLIQMLAPQLVEMGAAETNGRNCATTWPGYSRPGPVSPTAYSYPGNGVSGVVPTERAAESPFVPGEFVGLPQGTATGRYLLVFLTGLSGFAAQEVKASATLSGPEGPVELRTIDSTDPNVGPYMPKPSAFLIPVQPLKPLARYQAEVHWSQAGAPLLEQRFAFTTGSDSGAKPTALDKGRGGGCGRFVRLAKFTRRSAARAHERGVELIRHGMTAAQRRRGTRLVARGARLHRRARHFARLLRRCIASS
jgi:hypothetical protein